MRNYWLAVMVVVLNACSPAPSTPLDPQIAIESLAQLTLISGDPNFGQVSGSKTVIFAIRNTGDAASEIPTPTLSGTNASAFAIIQSTGCAAALPKNSTCSVRVNFNSSGKLGGAYGANLKIGTSLTIPLSASIAIPPSAQYGIFDGAVPLSSTLGLNFGNLTGSQVAQKILTIKNTGTVASPALSLNLTNNTFTISNSTCEGKILQSGQSCNFKILFSTAGKSAQVYLADLLFDSQVFPLTGAVTAPLPNDDPNSGVIIETFVNNEPLTAADLNLGILPNNQGVVKVLTFKNIGTATSTPMTAALSQNSNFFIISNLCQDKVLAPGASCSFRLVFSAVSKNAGAYNVSLTFPGVELPVAGEVLPTAECPLNTHLENSTCQNNIQPCTLGQGQGQKIWANGAYGSCTLSSCNSGYDLVNSQCLPACAVTEHRHPVALVCEANIIACTPPANAVSANQTWMGSTYGICTVTACQSTYHNESNTCVSDTRACAIAHGQGSQTWTGSSYGSCELVSCQTNFHAEGSACVSDLQPCDIAHGQGSQQWLGSQYSACTAQSCESAYHLANNQCAADVIDCSATIPNSATATQTWNGSAYAPCDLLTCAAAYHEETNTCVDDTRTCAIAHGQGSQTWTGTEYELCSAIACDSGYHLASNQCQSNILDCSATIANAASATQTWNGSNYGSCVVSSCVNGYEVNNNACVSTTYPLSLALGPQHSMALMSNGTVRATGNNNNYRLGDGTQVRRFAPDTFSAWANAKKIYPGRSWTCAIMSDDSVKCVGDNAYGQLGVGSFSVQTTPVTIATLQGAKELALSFGNVCALFNDNSVKCAGWRLGIGVDIASDSNVAISVPGFANAKNLYANNNAPYTCAIMQDNSVKCTGTQTTGLFALGNTTDQRVPVTISAFANAKKLFPGPGHLCAQFNDNSIKCAGTNNSGQLGTGATSGNQSTAQTCTVFSNVKDLALGSNATCALLNDNSVQCVGDNYYGGLGVGSTENIFTTPVIVTAYANAKNIYLNDYFMCVLLQNNTVKCSGYNNVGQLGDGTNVNKSTPVNISY